MANMGRIGKRTKVATAEQPAVMDDQLDKLLKSASTLQYDYLSALADRYEELGDDVRARACRWMRDNRKWPRPNMIVASQFSRRIVVNYWYWDLWTIQQDIHPSDLPFDDGLHWTGQGQDSSPATYTTEGEAIHAGAGWIGKWLKETDGNPCDSCDGTGCVTKIMYDPNDPPAYIHVKCQACKGTQKRTITKDYREQKEG